MTRISFHYVAALFMAIAMGFSLAACSTTGVAEPEPIIRTVEVQVPVDDPACPRAAVAELGTAPAFPDTDAAIRAAADLFARVQLLLAGRELREAREAALMGALVECAR